MKKRSFLKWAGGKYNSLDKLLSLLPAGRRFVEPFLGSGTVFINTSYESYLLAETNPDLINLFTALRSGGSNFVAYCKTFFIQENNNKAAYYSLRERFNNTKDLTEKSALFLYLNRHCYNGLCRYNQDGFYNVPFGSTKPKVYFPAERMQYFHNKLQNTELLCADFRKTFALAKKGDVIYCDPPYMPVSDTSDFTQYSGKAFTKEDQQDLALLAYEASSKGIMVLISNSDSDFVKDFYKDSKIFTFAVPRAINCKTESRQAVKEILAVFG